MSTIALRQSDPSSNVLAHTVSSSQDDVSKFLLERLQHFEQPATRQKRKQALNSVFDAFAESRKHEDMSPISEAAYKEATAFLQKLPFTLPVPEVMAECDGDLALEWYRSNYYSFVIGFSGNGIITYSGLFGKGRKCYGTELISEGVPASIIENIRRVFS